MSTSGPTAPLRIGADVRNSRSGRPPGGARHATRCWPAPCCPARSGQLRNLATTGGNLLQRTRCVYFQDVTTPCNKREPGTGCSAIGGYVRYHAILGASEHLCRGAPSDMAVAMTALDAQIVYVDADGDHRLPIDELLPVCPATQPDRDTNLPAGALITAVEIPALPDGAHSSYRKVRDRASYAFCTDLGGRRTGHRGRALCTRPASRSAASRTNPGAPASPSRRSSGHLPARRPSSRPRTPNSRKQNHWMATNSRWS